jgi:sodium transport system ATP-binding protein
MLDMAERMCDRLLILHRGRNIFAGTATELRVLAGATSLEDAFLKLANP